MPSWTHAITFEMPGIPHAKARPRFVAFGRNRGKVYADPKSQRYERAVAIHVRAFTKNKKLAPAGMPVRVDILAMYPRPKRLLRPKDPAGLITKCNRMHGDLDNHVKAILDGINLSGLWDDDGQVSCIRAESAYVEKGRRPCSRVTVYLPTQDMNHSGKDHTRDNER